MDKKYVLEMSEKERAALLSAIRIAVSEIWDWQQKWVLEDLQDKISSAEECDV